METSYNFKRVLVELVVENYAVVERVRVQFHRGLNLLTGETGSGKSIVVDALGLLFGGRSSPDTVRSGAAKARISGIFEIPKDPALHALLEQAGVEIEDGELLIEREVLAGGKSRAFVGSRPATVTLLRDIAPYLGDIHGQHDQQQLFSTDAQLSLLDAYAGAQDLLARVGELYRAWRETELAHEALEKSEQETLRLTDLWSFQKKEIEAAALQPNEEAELDQEKRVLRNVAKLQENANAAYAALYDSPQSIVSQLRVTVRRLEELSRIDSSVDPMLQALKPAEATIQDISNDLSHYVDKLEADPARLEAIETRLETIDKLKRKYGASIADVLQFLHKVSEQLSAVENAGERKADLRRRVEELSAQYAKSSAELTAQRSSAAAKLSKKVEKELDSLAMANSVFKIELKPAAWSEQGADRVEFLLSSNRGEEARSLDRVASGGELSRIALALKTSLGQPSAGIARTLVFDEVDTGIGGGVAEAVGRRLKKLSAASQVLCVTHLAQIASFADHHYHVEKREVKGRTVAEVEKLTPEARMREIGRMLSGHKVTPEALKHAEQLIRMGTEVVQ